MTNLFNGSTARALGVGALVVPVAVVGAVVLGGGDDGYVIKAEFKDTGGLRKNSDVKIGGVPGGKITKIEVTGKDTGLVTMKMRDGAVPVGKGATARSRPVNLLGEKFVDLDAGDLRKPLPSGTLLGLRDTGSPVELDDVLNTLDPTTRGRLHVLINEAGVGLNGRGTDLNAVLRAMPPALDETRELVASFAADTARLKRLASSGDRVVQELEAGKDDATRLVDTAERTLRITAANRRNLGRSVDQAPGTLRQLRGTLDELSTASGRLRPAARELRATSAPLAGTLARLPKFADDAEPALDAAREAAPVLGRLGKDGAPVVARLEPTARELERFSTVFSPLSTVLDRQTAPLLRVMEAWTRTIQTRDNVGHLFRTEIVPDKELITALLGRLSTRDQKNRPQDPGPPASADGSPLAKPTRKDRAEPGAPTTQPATVAPPAGSAPQSPSDSSAAPDSGNAGGVSDLLDYLLG